MNLAMGSQDKKNVAYFRFTNFLQLIFWLTSLALDTKNNEKLVNQEICNTVFILNALYQSHSRQK
jgi:hypothetical protein